MGHRRSGRVLLDTNVWNYLAAHSGAAELAAACRGGGVTVVVAPAAVYEALAVTDKTTLSARSRLLTDERWKRLMPEAYLESQEILDQVRKFRPCWLLSKPPRGESQKLFRDWRRNGTGFWARVRERPYEAAEHVRRLQAGILEKARDESKEARKKQIGSDYPAWEAPLNKYWAQVPASPGSSENMSVSAWRHDSFIYWSRLFDCVIGQPIPTECTHSHIDWLSAEIDFSVAKASNASWYQFWHLDVDDEEMPRTWLRWASGLLQQFSKWTPGTPGDNALSVYLLDADWFVTADSGMYRIAKKVHADCPFVTAFPLLVGADGVGAKQALKLIESGFSKLS
jgi:hypothetical protein